MPVAPIFETLASEDDLSAPYPALLMTPAPGNQPTRSFVVDPPVGPHSDRRDIHRWLDELEALRRTHDGDPQALAVIDEELARAVGWLHGRDDLAGAGP